MVLLASLIYVIVSKAILYLTVAEKHVTQLLLFSAMCSGQKGVERGGGRAGCGRR